MDIWSRSKGGGLNDDYYCYSWNKKSVVEVGSRSHPDDSTAIENDSAQVSQVLGGAAAAPLGFCEPDRHRKRIFPKARSVC